MRSLLIALTLFTALFASQSNAIVGSIGKSAIKKYDGTIEQPEKLFINVKNGSAGTLAVGTAVVLDLTADDGATVTTSATAGQSPICLIAVSCTVGSLCKCQTYGIFDSGLFDVTAANAVAGSRWYMSTNNAGYISARATSVATEVAGGVFYDAASASGSVQVFIKL